MRDKLLEMLELKQLPRTGWVRSGVENPESVAAHSWGMAVLALRLAPKDLDLVKILSLCLIHDLPEVRVGDLTPHDDISNKAESEHKAMSEMAPQWLPLFEEYEAGDTAEAKFVKQIDKLDMGLQAMLYQNKQDITLDEFIESAKSNISDKNLLGFLD
ncbi:MAG TPA: HD domain-containing protein [Candidatus Poseidoniales archaeon]|nr:MAG TPA: HD domain-containing protein [Candidatus Poseidoniales archaeon]HII58430.1 HD domain-containing protein [Candidatus Poseidoniaceae archaeon]|tara:strand:- start:34 stop:507 length:474 start_codon:yes stop_codon:yes gene_type:complete